MSGLAPGDIVDMLSQVKPDYYVPVYANHFFLKEARNLAVKRLRSRGAVPDNGSVIGSADRVKQLPQKYRVLFVDGLGVSDSQHVVLRDRQVLAEDGMIVVITTVAQIRQAHPKSGCISRGFVFLKDNKELIEDIRHRVKKMVIESIRSSGQIRIRFGMISMIRSGSLFLRQRRDRWCQW